MYLVTRSASANVIMRKSTPPKEYQNVEQNNYSTQQHQEEGKYETIVAMMQCDAAQHTLKIL